MKSIRIGYRFKRIYRTMPFSSPAVLRLLLWIHPAAGKRGRYLLAVEDQNVDASKSVYSYFDGKANQRVKIQSRPESKW